ncbi:MAG TPA: type ISP restriction/modification enzyme, partial [Vicinamibacterales bacterium]|nr:type ISP restriction/modification enzyme [Vicinamibacterales bacterium]
ISYDSETKRLRVGVGFVEKVTPGMWEYQIDGKQVLAQWFSYRKAHRERPIIGDRRPPSPLGDIQPSAWLAEYSTELINVLNVLGMLISVEPEQKQLLKDVCEGAMISATELEAAGVFAMPAKGKKAGGPATLF